MRNEMNEEQVKELTDKIISGIVCASYNVNYTADEKDILRNHVNYGMLTAYADIHRRIGHDVEIDSADDGDMIRIHRVKLGMAVIDYRKMGE